MGVNRVQQQVQMGGQNTMGGGMPMGSMSQPGMMGQMPGGQMQMGQMPGGHAQVQQTMQQQAMMQRQAQHMAMQPSMTSNGLRFNMGEDDASRLEDERRKKSSFSFIGETVKKEAGQ